MYPLIPYLSLSIKDAKGRTATARIHCEVFDEDDYIAGKRLGEWADKMIGAIRPLIKGEIVKASMVEPVSLDFTPEAPDPTSDTCERGLFSFRTELGHPVKILLPTWDEQFTKENSNVIDVEATEVANFIGLCLDGADAVPGVLEGFMDVTDNRGNEVDSLQKAQEHYVKSGVKTFARV